MKQGRGRRAGARRGGTAPANRLRHRSAVRAALDEIFVLGPDEFTARSLLRTLERLMRGNG